MQLTPRYGADPVLTLDGPPADILVPTVRQRRRLAEAVAAFDDEQWAHPSRCEGWSARDVVSHLETTDGFWALSIAAGLRGEPTRFLASFDPVATPAQLVAASEGVSSSELLDRYLASSESLLDLLSSIDGDGWSARAEAPPGHLSISAVAHHALWDSWVHERDILVPMGIAPDEEADEIAACLRYAAGLSPAFAVTLDAAAAGTMTVVATDPELAVVVEIDGRAAVRSGHADADFQLDGDAVELVEALSIRRPLDRPIPASVSWMLRGLYEAFDAEQP